MAIIHNFSNVQTGLTITNAYTKISRFQGDKLNVRFDVETYVSSQSRLDGKSAISHQSYEIPYGNGFSITSLYTYLKTLAEFSGAIDA